ncbi:MAG: DNA polymerase/3'-5' exonuclease PolX [Nitrospinota bacterium]|nr:MAG: DNA polymerase/3'-5' exonuclease PolX [Nitrospinota bacterium]
MDKKEIARFLREMGTLLELSGANPFRARAYHNAARTLETTSADVQALIESGQLSTLKGIGKSIAELITEYVKTGEAAEYAALKASIPPGLLEMLHIPGLGPKKVYTIYQKLGISSVGELEYACQENRLASLEGFGPKSQEKILQGIAYRKKTAQWHLYPEVYPHAEYLCTMLRTHPHVIRISLAGSLRRRKEVIRDIDILVSSDDPPAVSRFFTTVEGVERVLQQGESRVRVLLDVGVQADLRIVSDEAYPYALHHFTGSKEHNVALRQLARSRSLLLNEYGLFRQEEGERIRCRDEGEIFQALGLDYIPPELRENRGEIEAAQEGRLPHLLNEEDIQGVFHVHTHYSDGVDSLEHMARGAQELGYRYLGIADHSKSARYANGLSPQRVREQWAEIDRLNRRLSGITLLKGIELEILPDGSVDDYPEEILAGFDYVVASVHSRFSLPQEAMTRRIIRALQHPHVTMLGHPTGRLLLAREPYAVDLRAVIAAARETGKIIEINANPRRLDLDWEMCRQAKAEGVKLAINPDAHRVADLAYLRYGVYVARRGWLEASDVVNTLSLSEVRTFLKARRA